MPFKSEKQRRYMHANLPKIAKRWEKDYASGGIARIPFQIGGNPLLHNRTLNNTLQVAQNPDQYNQLMMDNMQKMNPLALDVMTGQHQPGISPHRGGYGPIDPYGNIQMELEKKDFYESPQGLAFLRNKMGNMFSGATNTMGNMFSGATNTMGNIFSGVKNKGGALMGNILGMAAGIPGLGMLLGNMRPDNPYEKFQKQMFSDMYSGHDFGNKDPFGKNIRSLFGNYDVVEQFDKLAGSKIGQKYGYEEAMADGIIDEEELQTMKDKGLKGWQLNRLRALAHGRKKATDWYDKTKRPPGLDGSKPKGDSPTIFKTRTTGGGSGPTYGPHTPTHHGTKAHGPGGRFDVSNRSSPKSSSSYSGGPGRRHHSFAQGGIVSLWPK